MSEEIGKDASYERRIHSIIRSGALLAINLLFVMVWGFTGISKLVDGMPSWFGDKFGQTILARFPGLTVSFWLLAAAEVLAFVLAVAAICAWNFLAAARHLSGD